MGPISPNGPKEFGRLTEKDIMDQSARFIDQQKLCSPEDDIFKSLQIVVCKIHIYGHRHLLDHIRNTAEKKRKIQYLLKWKTLHFQNLDLLFQNLIRKKIMRIEEEQVFTMVDVIQKHSQLKEGGVEIYQRGEEVLRQKKVGLIVFVGCTSTKGEQTFNKEFYKVKADDETLFQILMQKLSILGDKYGFPATYIFYNSNNYLKITDFLKTYKYRDHIQTCLQSMHPILNLNGNLCLKNKQLGDVIEMPTGSGDFYHASIKGVNILQKMKMDNINYVVSVDCENIFEMVLDPYLIGLLDKNQEYDLMYKCTHPQDQREKIFRRVVLQNGVPKADTFQALSAYMNYSHKYRLKNNENVFSSPVWMNSLVFNLQRITNVLQNANQMASFPQTVTFTMKYMSYWSPIDGQSHNNQSCYIFQKEISDLLINNLFKSQAVMVERQQEYLPIISEKSQYSWESAIREYANKKQKIIRSPIKIKKQQVQETPFVQKQQKIEVSQVKPSQIPISIAFSPQPRQSRIKDEQSEILLQEVPKQTH